MNVWQRIDSALRTSGIKVYPSGAHIGVCRSPYCVVQQAGTYSAAGGFGRNTYTGWYVHAYVPLGSYAALDELLGLVRRALRGLEDERLIYFTGGESVHLIDDAFAAHTAYLEYRSFGSSVHSDADND